MKKKIYLLMTISLLSVVMFSSLSANYDSQFTYTDVPNNYYDLSSGALEDKDLLKTELNQIISRNYKKYSYAQAWDLIRKSDEDPNNPDNVLLLYTGKSMKKLASGQTEPKFGTGSMSGLNREVSARNRVRPTRIFIT